METLKSNFIILTEHKLIIEHLSGVLELESYKRFKKTVIYNELYSSSYNYIINFKNVDFKMSPSEVIQYVEFLKKIPEITGNKKLAFITNSPNQIVPATIYKMKQGENNNQTVEIFSTYEKALHWINTDLTINELVTIFKELKNNY